MGAQIASKRAAARSGRLSGMRVRVTLTFDTGGDFAMLARIVAAVVDAVRVAPPHITVRIDREPDPPRLDRGDPS